MVTERRYHHGDLRRVVLEAAVKEIGVGGPAALSMREIARRAGVSHAAPAHHFGDRRGVVTAIATEGFGLLHLATSRAASEPDTLLQIALAYIRFALEYPAHFDVMFRPDILRLDDRDLVSARDSAFETFYGVVRNSLNQPADAEFTGAVVAAWAIVHGFATLWLSGSLSLEFGDDPEALALLAGRGLVDLARVTAQQLPSEADERARSPGGPR